MADPFNPPPTPHSPLPTPYSLLPIITIRNLSNAYINRSLGAFGKKEIKPVLNNVNLDIAAGEIFGISGESGCGKTSLARCILGLIDYQGEIVIDGQQQHRFRQRHNSGKAQMIFQDPGASLNPAKKIGWLLEEPLVIHRIGTAQQRSLKVNEMLARMGLDSSCKTRRANELSGGQKQRVCIGRALMLNPKILIADEAVSSLDVSAGAQILNLFRELRETMGLTIIFISHNTDAAEYLCDRIAVIKNGAISF
jgi:ABC-type dipeptide/oligopeptide/nickel transport system ATPase subunit